MSLGKKHRVPTSGDGPSLSQNPFASLGTGGLPPGEATAPAPKRRQPRTGPTKRGRVDVRRETAGRGGRTVTVVSGFQKISSPELEDLVREFQRACAAGGTLKKGQIEIQGDRCEVVMNLLVKKGFRPVRTGG